MTPEAPEAPPERGRSSLDSHGNRRQRDTSWERRWGEQVRREAEEFSPRPTRRFTPGKLKVSHWENRVKNEEGLPPRTPPPRRKILNVDVCQEESR